MNKTITHNHLPVLLVICGFTVLVGTAVIFLSSIVYQDFLELRSLRAELVVNQTKSSSFLKLTELSQSTADDYAKLAKFVVTKDTLVGIIDLAERSVRQGGAAISVVSAGELGGLEAGKTKYGWRIAFKVEGNFDQAQKGLIVLESLPVAKKVASVKLVKKLDTNQWVGDIIIDVPTIK